MKKKISWDDIQSIDNLEIDWEYEEENPLGRRAWVRILNVDLYRLLDKKTIAVRIVSSKLNYTGYLQDISRNGLAVIVNKELKTGVPVKVGFFLGKRKIISRAVVRNSHASGSNFRIGIEFIDLPEDDASFIVELNASKCFG